MYVADTVPGSRPNEEAAGIAVYHGRIGQLWRGGVPADPIEDRLLRVGVPVARFSHPSLQVQSPYFGRQARQGQAHPAITGLARQVLLEDAVAVANGIAPRPA